MSDFLTTGTENTTEGFVVYAAEDGAEVLTSFSAIWTEEPGCGATGQEGLESDDAAPDLWSLFGRQAA